MKISGLILGLTISALILVGFKVNGVLAIEDLPEEEKQCNSLYATQNLDNRENMWINELQEGYVVGFNKKKNSMSNKIDQIKRLLNIPIKKKKIILDINKLNDKNSNYDINQLIEDFLNSVNKIELKDSIFNSINSNISFFMPLFYLINMKDLDELENNLKYIYDYFKKMLLNDKFSGFSIYDKEEYIKTIYYDKEKSVINQLVCLKQEQLSFLEKVRSSWKDLMVCNIKNVENNKDKFEQFIQYLIKVSKCKLDLYENILSYHKSYINNIGRAVTELERLYSNIKNEKNYKLQNFCINSNEIENVIEFIKEVEDISKEEQKYIESKELEEKVLLKAYETVEEKQRNKEEEEFIIKAK